MWSAGIEGVRSCLEGLKRWGIGVMNNEMKYIMFMCDIRSLVQVLPFSSGVLYCTDISLP
jgi:hypothetical protein